MGDFDVRDLRHALLVGPLRTLLEACACLVAFNLKFARIRAGFSISGRCCSSGCCTRLGRVRWTSPKLEWHQTKCGRPKSQTSICMAGVTWAGFVSRRQKAFDFLLPSCKVKVLVKPCLGRRLP